MMNMKIYSKFYSVDTDGSNGCSDNSTGIHIVFTLQKQTYWQGESWLESLTVWSISLQTYSSRLS